MKTYFLTTIIIPFVLIMNLCSLNGQLSNVPGNFPKYEVTINDSPDEGYFFVAADQMPDKKPGWLIMIDNYGTPVYYRYFNKVLNSFCVQPNGLLSFMGRGTEAKFYIMDSTFKIIDSVKTISPYTRTGPHDFIAMKNGHFLLFANDPKVIDMRSYGGKINATVTGCVIQELDENKNVVFTWSTWDHFQISDSYADLTGSSVDLIHQNSLEVDSDGNIFLISRSLNEVTKINRQTGDIIWRLGGKNNQFTFTDPSSMFSFPHNFSVLPNGNFTIFDNGNDRDQLYSRALEYSIDQVNKVVDLVWNFDAEKTIYADNSGGTLRLSSGNTVVSYGYSISNPALLEVNPDSSVAFRLELPDKITSYKSGKHLWKTTLFEPSTSEIDFGEWDGYTENSIYLLSVKNNSDKPLTLTSYSTLTDGFFIDKTFPVEIPANGQTILPVVFFPININTGYIKDVLTINSDTNSSTLVQRISQQVKLSGRKSDTESPVSSISLAGKSNVPLDTVIYITFSEPVRFADNTEFNYLSVDPLIVFRRNNSGGENVPFNAVINTDKNKITIKPDLQLDHSQSYYIAVKSGYEDYSDNSGEFNEAAFSTIDLTAPTVNIDPADGTRGVFLSIPVSVHYSEPVRNIDNSEITSSQIASRITFKETNISGPDVSFTVTVNPGKTTISVQPNEYLMPNKEYYIAIGDIVEDYNNNKAAAISSTFTTGNSTSIFTGSLSDQFKVYPNPSRGLFRFEFQERESIHLRVTTLNGRQVYDFTIRDVNTHLIDLSNFPDGIYLLEFEIEGSHARGIFKLVKQNE